MSTIAAGTTSTTALVNTGDTTGKLTFQTNGTTTAMTIDTSQNVGIGTSSPGYKLDVVGSTNGSIVERLGNSNTGASTNAILQLATGATYERYVNLATYYNSQYFQISASNITTSYTDFDTQIWRNNAGTERMRIDSSGNVLVGASSSVGFGGVTPNFQVTNTSFTGSDVDGGTIATFGSSSYGLDKGSGVVFGFKYNTAGSYVTAARVRGAKENGTDGNYAGYLGFDTRANGGNLTERLRIGSDGKVTIVSDTLYITNIPTTATAGNCLISDGEGNKFYRSTSSIKYKRNVVNMQRGLADVQKLRPVNFNGVSDFDGNKLFAGFIAEEIEALGMKEFVIYNGKNEPDGLQYANMVALLTKAIQELKAEVDALKAQLAKV